MISSLNRRNSRYVQGGSTEQFADRLGYWQRRIFPMDETDEIYVIEAKYHKRPWLLAHDKYQDVELMWIILQYNTILDVDTEFVTGREIRLPTATRLFMDILTRKSTASR